MGLENMLTECWPEWEIVKELGQGSFGTVYEIKKSEGSIESRAAVKIISIPQNSSDLDTYRAEGMSLEETRTTLYEVVTEFENEIQLMQKFKGTQNIVSVEDYKIIESKEKVGWTILIRMELLTPFLSYVADKKLTENEVIKIGIDICNALELCELANVIHRDIKPQNIFVNSFGNFKLGDFGVAKTVESTTGSLSQKGTLNYMAPEVYSGSKYDKTADIYSLGIVLYNLMNNGRMPFVDPDKQLVTFADREEALKKRMECADIPAPKTASEGLANVLFRALSPNPAGRFSNAKEFRLALESLINGTYEIVDLDKTVSLRTKTSMTVIPNAVKRQENNSNNGKKRSIAFFSAGCAILVVVIVGIIIAVGGKKTSSSEDMVANNSTSSKNNDNNDVQPTIDETTDMVESETSETKTTETEPTETEPVGTEPVFDEATAINAIVSDVDGLVDNGDYVSAITLINDSLETYNGNNKLSNKLEEVTKKYIKEKDKELDKYEDNKEYYQAIKCIDEMGEIIKVDEYTLERRVGFMYEYLVETEEKDADEYEYVKNEYTSNRIDEFDIVYEKGEYVEAFNLLYNLHTIVGSDDNIKKCFEKCEDEYVAIVIKNTNDEINNNNYLTAYCRIKLANDIYPGNREIKKIMNSLIENNYYYLYNRTPYENNYNNYYKKSDSIYIAGKKYDKGFTVTANGRDGTVFYYRLGYGYDKLCFECGPEDSNNRYDAAVYIYADDKLIYSFNVGRTSVAEKHEIDIAGCDVLKIKVIDADSQWLTTVAFADVKLNRDYENYYKMNVEVTE